MGNLAFLKTLSSQSLGFSYGKPQRVDEKSLTVLLPILRQTSINRDYVTWPESDQCLAFDTGRIDRMQLRNASTKNIFVRSGTLFRGATQERASVRSAVIFPGEKVEVEVRCIHASRPISGSTNTKFGGITPLSFDQANYTSGYTPQDQHTFWANVGETTKMYSAMSGGTQSTAQSFSETGSFSLHGANIRARQAMRREDFGGLHIHDEVSYQAPLQKQDDLASHMDDFAANFERILSKVKRQAKQVGVALITDSGVQTIETFDHKDSWKALHESAVKRMGAELVKEDINSVFEFKPDHAAKLVDKVLGLEWKVNPIWNHRPNNGEPSVEILGLTAPSYVGELVEIDGKVVHLVILKQK